VKRALGCAGLLCCCVACGAPLMKLPSAPGTPAADAADALTEATAACRAVTSMTADIAASGTVGGQRLRGHILAGLAAPASARLEAVAPAGPPIFIFTSKDRDATLLLPRDDRVVEHGAPAEILEAVTGVPVDAAALRETLAGCPPLASAAGGHALGADWRLLQIGRADVYLRRDPKLARWQVAAIVHHAAGSGGDPGRVALQGPRGGDWRAEYRDFQSGLPRTIHLASADRARFDLSLTLSQVALGETLGADVFRVDVPRSAERISVDDLRHARPGVRED